MLSSTYMYDRIKNLYDTNQIDATGVQNAVTKGLITQVQADEILGTTGTTVPTGGQPPVQPTQEPTGVTTPVQPTQGA